MKYSRCRGIEKDWSAVTLGCWQLAKSGGWGDYCTDSEADATVKAALDCGITAFDTAEGYGDGQSEERLGKALGGQKDDVIVISKIWPDAELSHAGYQERLDNSLRFLKRDYVDLYLVHWPSGFDSNDAGKRLCEVMVGLKDSGKAHTIGLSNFDCSDMGWLGQGLDEFVVNQVPYSLLEPEYGGKACDMCKKHNLEYMAYSPTCKGLLAREMSESDLMISTRRNDELFQEPIYGESVKVFKEVEAIGDELNLPAATVALAWVLAQGNMLTAIMGGKRVEQVKECALAGDVELSPEHLKRLDCASADFLNFKSKVMS